MERFDRRRRSDRLYRPPQRRPGRDARLDELRGCGLVRCNDLQLHRGGERRGRQHLIRFDQRERHYRGRS